jgi:hypothetical protein
MQYVKALALVKQARTGRLQHLMLASAERAVLLAQGSLQAGDACHCPSVRWNSDTPSGNQIVIGAT